MYQNLWDTIKAMLKINLTALNTYSRIEKKSQINDVSSHIMNLGEKKEQNKLKASGGKVLIKSRNQ